MIIRITMRQWRDHTSLYWAILTSRFLGLESGGGYKWWRSLITLVLFCSKKIDCVPILDSPDVFVSSSACSYCSGFAFGSSWLSKDLLKSTTKLPKYHNRLWSLLFQCPWRTTTPNSILGHLTINRSLNKHLHCSSLTNSRTLGLLDYPWIMARSLRRNVWRKLWF